MERIGHWSIEGIRNYKRTSTEQLEGLSDIRNNRVIKLCSSHSPQQQQQQQHHSFNKHSFTELESTSSDNNQCTCLQTLPSTHVHLSHLTLITEMVHIIMLATKAIETNLIVLMSNAISFVMAARLHRFVLAFSILGRYLETQLKSQP